MSFFRRFLSRSKSTVCETNNDGEQKREVSENGTQPDSPKASHRSFSDTDISGSNGESEPVRNLLELDYKATRRELNSEFQKHNRMAERVSRRKEIILIMNREIVHVKKLIAQMSKEVTSLDTEIKNQKSEINALLQQYAEPTDIDNEFKKKDPILHKRYIKAKTVSETKNLLLCIRDKQKTYRHYEAVTYRKYLDAADKFKSGKLINFVQSKKDSKEQKKLPTDLFKRVVVVENTQDTPKFDSLAPVWDTRSTANKTVSTQL